MTGCGGKDDVIHDTRAELIDWEKRIIVARTIELAVIVNISANLYIIDIKVHIQSSGGPIGLITTAHLASVVMMVRDRTWDKLMVREGVQIDLLLSYVDDYRLFLAALNEGWFWDGNRLLV